MSHDPSHFDLEVKGYDKHVALTLSGHTHGMQFGIEIQDGSNGARTASVPQMGRSL